MLLRLSEKELLALERLTSGDATAGQLASSLGMKGSALSRLLKSLGEKGLVLTERRGTTKVVKLSPASHAQDFRKLYESRPKAQIEEWLSGSAMGILIPASQDEGMEMARLPEEAGCSRPTAYRALNALYAAGVAAKYENRVRITDPLVRAFASSYADNLQRVLQKQVHGINVSVRVRGHVILRTDAAKVPEYFSETGISALAKQGLEARLTDYRDYYFNLGGKPRQLEIEEMFIHALVLAALPQHQDRPLLTMFFAKSGKRLEPGKLRLLAKEYHVEGQLDEVRRFAESYKKMRRME